MLSPGNSSSSNHRCRECHVLGLICIENKSKVNLISGTSTSKINERRPRAWVGVEDNRLYHLHRNEHSG